MKSGGKKRTGEKSIWYIVSDIAHYTPLASEQKNGRNYVQMAPFCIKKSSTPRFLGVPDNIGQVSGPEKISCTAPTANLAVD